jgi:hypothetical protein
MTVVRIAIIAADVAVTGAIGWHHGPMRCPMSAASRAICTTRYAPVGSSRCSRDTMSMIRAHSHHGRNTRRARTGRPAPVGDVPFGRAIGWGVLT